MTSAYILFYNNKRNKIHASGFRIYPSLEALDESLSYYRSFKKGFTLLIGEEFLQKYHNFKEFLEDVEIKKIDGDLAKEIEKAFWGNSFGVVPE